MHPYLREAVVHHEALLLPAGVARVDHVQEEIGLADFVERGAEARDEMVRELADEADGVGEKQTGGPGDRETRTGRAPSGLPVRRSSRLQRHFPRQRIQRRKQPVLHHDLAISRSRRIARAQKRAKDRALAGVRVADQRRAERTLATLALDLARLLHFDEPLLEHPDPVADESAVGLELRLAGAPHADAAAELLEVRPQLFESRQRVLELRQLHLELRLRAPRPECEDIENELGAVDDAFAELGFEGLALARREFLVEEHQRRLETGDQRLELLDLAFADIGRGVWLFDRLSQLPHDARAGGVGEARELLEMFRDHVSRAAALERRADEDGAFLGRRERDQFARHVRKLAPEERVAAVCSPGRGGISVRQPCPRRLAPGVSLRRQCPRPLAPGVSLRRQCPRRSEG